MYYYSCEIYSNTEIAKEYESSKNHFMKCIQKQIMRCLMTIIDKRVEFMWFNLTYCGIERVKSCFCLYAHYVHIIVNTCNICN